MWSKFKLWAAGIFGGLILIGVAALKHFKRKSERLEREVEVKDTKARIEEEVIERQRELRAEEDAEIQEAIESAKTNGEYLERDPFAGLRDKD